MTEIAAESAPTVQAKAKPITARRVARALRWVFYPSAACLVISKEVLHVRPDDLFVAFVLAVASHSLLAETWVLLFDPQPKAKPVRLPAWFERAERWTAKQREIARREQIKAQGRKERALARKARVKC